MARRDRDSSDSRSRNSREDARSRSTSESSSSKKLPAERSDSSRSGGSIPARNDDDVPFGLRLSDQMSRFLGNFGFGRDFPWGDQRWVPQVDVLRRGDELVVRADLPGMKREDISVDVNDNVLTIRGERRSESSEERGGYYWHERSAGSFYRSIPLPEGADPDHAQARFKDGVLEVSLHAPKETERARGRHIDIR